MLLKKFFEKNPKIFGVFFKRQYCPAERGKHHQLSNEKGGENVKPNRREFIKQCAFQNFCNTVLHNEACDAHKDLHSHKDEENKNKLVVDPEIAPIVVEIFELRAKGTGIEAMCRILNEKDYPSPGRLRYERGIITNNNKKGSALPWNRHVLKDLLLNVAYIGNLAQGRSAQCLYKGQKFHWTDSSEWDVVYDTHPAIISIELWDKVQEVNNKSTRAAKESHGKYAHLPKRVNPYGSVIRCADCGRVLKYVRGYSKPTKDGTVKDY